MLLGVAAEASLFLVVGDWSRGRAQITTEFPHEAEVCCQWQWQPVVEVLWDVLLPACSPYTTRTRQRVTLALSAPCCLLSFTFPMESHTETTLIPSCLCISAQF